ncbi:hypothetical protein Chor_014649 [Crotalus horridus]
MAYQLYRNTTLGNSLQESLDELIQGSLNTYRFCDNVWTFVLNDVEFREVTEVVKVDKIRVRMLRSEGGLGPLSPRGCDGQGFSGSSLDKERLSGVVLIM